MTKNDFGKMLMLKLKQTDDIVVLSRWAYQIYLDNSQNLELGLKEILLDLMRMEDVPEFEHSHDELIQLAKSLQNEM